MVPRNIGIVMTYRTNNMNLVGGIPTPLKNMSSSVGNIIPNTWKNKKGYKPPARHIYIANILN